MDHQQPQEKAGLSRYLSPVSAWALAFGCAVGWGSFAMPGTTFLPIAGPLGTIIGLLIGAAFMFVLAACYSRMMNRFPDAGGAFSYTKNVLGGDHGFLCAWMLLLTYIAIIWANASAVTLFVRYLFGDIFCFGFSYEVAGYTVYFGEILLSTILIAVTAMICMWNNLPVKWIQTICALLLFGCITACFIAVVAHNGFSNLKPLFSQGSSPVVQILGIVILAPWAFIGFESISHSTEEFKFKIKKSRTVFVFALITGVLSYIMLTLCASMAHPDGYSGWGEYIGKLAECNGIEKLPTFYSAQEAMGDLGFTLLGIAALCGILTGIIGHTIALSRLIYALAKDNMLPKKLAALNKRSVPWIAVIAIAIFSCFILFLGHTAIGWIVDVTTIGATIVYAYISICAFVDGKRCHRKMSMIFGVIGILFSLVVIIVFVFPNLFIDSKLPTESYMILIIWCILGMIVFRLVVNKDTERRFGKSFIVWVVLLFLIVVVSIIWVNEVTGNETQAITNDVQAYHLQHAEDAGLDVDDENVHAVNDYTIEKINSFGGLIERHILVLALLMILSLGVVFSIFSVIKRREQQLEAERVHAEQSSRAKSLFLSNMSHDIRTPMNAVTGYTALALQEEDLPDKVRSYLEKIDFSGKRLLSLINDILDMSRIESGKVELETAPCDLFVMFDQISDIFAAQMKSKSLNYTIDYSEAENRYVICDKHRLDRVIMNLISNAYKFTPEGGDINVRLRQTGTQDDIAHFEITVKDSGIGMSPDFVKHIFDAFERERSNTVSHQQGTGLGMSISKSLIEMMGGTISVASEKHKGTTFVLTVSFPITTKDAVHEVDDYSDIEDVDFEGSRLLLVEDNPINCEIASEILKRADFEIEVAENGKVAVDMVAAAEPGYYDIILMDIMMPIMNGYEASAAIREMDDDRSMIPIIALSANTFESDRKAAMDAGMNAHVSKPFQAEELIAAIAENLEN